MFSDQEWQEENDLPNIKSRFEDMIKNNASYFFDSDELEDLIDYYLDENNQSKAMDVIKYAIELHPNSAQFQLKYAMAFVAAFKPHLALKIMKSIPYTEFPFDFYTLKSKIYFQLGQYDYAIGCLEEAKNSIEGQEDREEILMGLAFNYKGKKDYIRAEKILKQILEKNHKQEMALLELHWLSQDMNTTNKFIDWLKDFLDEHPFAMHAWLLLGQCYNEIGKQEKALNAFEFAISIEEDYLSAHFEKAETLVDLDKYKEAIETYEEILKHQEPDSSTYLEIGNCYLNTKDYIKALKFLKKASKLDEKDIEIWAGLSETYLHLDEIQTALFYIKKCLRVEPKDSYYLMSYGTIMKKINFLKEAEKSLLSALEEEPDSEIITIELCDTLFLKSSTEKAAEYCENFLHTHADASKLRYRFVAYLLVLGKENEAENQLYIAHAQNKDGIIDLFGYLPEEYFTEHIINTIVDFDLNDEL